MQCRVFERGKRMLVVDRVFPAASSGGQVERVAMVCQQWADVWGVDSPFGWTRLQQQVASLSELLRGSGHHMQFRRTHHLSCHCGQELTCRTQHIRFPEGAIMFSLSFLLLSAFSLLSLLSCFFFARNPWFHTDAPRWSEEPKDSWLKLGWSAVLCVAASRVHRQAMQRR